MGFLDILGIHGNQDAQHTADSEAAAANAYRANAATQYGNLGTEGFTNTGMFSAQVPGLISDFKKNAGIDQTTSGANNPYSLTPEQQTVLNGHVDDLTKRQNTAIEQLRASLAQKGITDPRYIANAEANIRQGFGGLITQHQANFADTARQQKQAALTQLMQYLMGVNQAGTGQQEAAGGGNLNLAGSSQTASNVAQSQQNANDASFNAGIGDLFNIGAFLGGGGVPGVFGGIKGSGSGSKTTASVPGFSMPDLGGGFDNPFGGVQWGAPSTPSTPGAPGYNPYSFNPWSPSVNFGY